MFNQNATSNKNKILTIISIILYVITAGVLTYITLDVITPVLNGVENADLGFAFALVILIIFWVGSAIVFLISTILSVISAISVKKEMQSKAVFIVNIIFAILPFVTLAVNVALYFITASIV